MADAVLVKPDTSFLRSVLGSGGGDLKKCFQCATCSVVCTLSPEDDPFPRRQMIEAQWGLKDRLMADPAIWLCHNCGDCTRHCPRGARPGDVFGALRQEAIRHFAFPGFLGSLVASPRAFALLLLVPVVVFAGMALGVPKGAPAAELEFADMFPIPALEVLFFALSGLVMIGFAIGLVRFVRALKVTSGYGGIMAGLWPALLEIIAHKRFGQCGGEEGRYWGHLLTVWGFMGLALMGTVVGIGSMLGIIRTPLPLTHPWKIFANLCAVVILIGGLILVADRIKDPVKRAASTYFDWLFLGTLVGVVLTGILAQVLRLGQSAAFMYPTYFVHLVLVFGLFLYAPYSKFAHLVYRTVAMAAAKRRQ